MTVLLIISFLLFVLLSALCSGSETGVYRISKVNLRINAEHNKKLSIMLKDMLSNTSELIFSILIANNVFNYFTTAIATYLFTQYYDTNAEYYATIVTTPFLFIFGEVVPKNLFFLRADFLMVIAASPLWVIHKTLKTLRITPAMKIAAEMMSKLFNMPSTGRSFANIRSTINIISDETRHEGLLSRVQWDIMNRMTTVSNTTIASVMVPLDSVVMANSNASKENLRRLLAKYPYTRIPVYKAHKGNILGYVNIYKALNSKDDDFSVISIMKEIKTLPAQMTVIDAIKTMNKEGLRMALVCHKSQKLGIITIKDLAEELTGELSVC